MGIIGFKNLKVLCIIGVLPEERVQEQNIFIDLKVEYDFTRVASTDNLEDTINYVTLADYCITFAQSKKARLLEKLAQDIIQEILLKQPVSWAWIKIKKPGALPQAECAIVEFEKHR